jgi:hypothetical protein
MTQQTISSAPMAAAPIKYRPDGEVDWGNMWETFCGLAQEGGPPHRAELLTRPQTDDTFSAAYNVAADEIIRGIREVSGLDAYVAEPGWIAVMCPSETMAHWLSGAILEEKVEARSAGTVLLVPVGSSFTLKGEIKSVITVVAKTTHYWQTHLPDEVKVALRSEQWITDMKGKLLGWFKKKPV